MISKKYVPILPDMCCVKRGFSFHTRSADAHAPPHTAVPSTQVFKGFGRIENIWVARNPPGFAFVTFSDPRDAEDAVRDQDGRDFRGSKCVSYLC